MAVPGFVGKIGGAVGRAADKARDGVNNGIEKLSTKGEAGQGASRALMTGIAAASRVAASVANTVRNVAHAVKAAIPVLTNPVFWIAVAVIHVVIFVILGGMAGYQTFGQAVASCGDTEEYSVTADLKGQLANNEDAKKAVGVLLNPDKYGHPELKGKFGKVQIAGILGNWQVESNITFNQAEIKGTNLDNHLNSSSNEEAQAFLDNPVNRPAGIGIAQWTDGDGSVGTRGSKLIKVANEMGKHWWEPEPQIKLMLDEMSGSYYDALNGNNVYGDESLFDTKDPKKAAATFLDVYEGVPMTPSRQQRIDEAQRIYDEDLGSGGDISTSGTTGSAQASCDGSGGGDGSVGDKISKFVEKISDDNSHGYSQPRRGGNPDYDCSSLVYFAVTQGAGIKLDTDYPFTTDGMGPILEAAGFEHFTWDGVYGGPDQGKLKRGDILVNPAEHTEVYLGDGKYGGAHSSRVGDGKDGPAGDQKGTEIDYVAYSGGSTYATELYEVYRYKG